MSGKRIDSSEFTDNTEKQSSNVLPIVLMLQYTIPAAQCRVKMEEGVSISPVDICASATKIILEPNVIVSIIV